MTKRKRKYYSKKIVVALSVCVIGILAFGVYQYSQRDNYKDLTDAQIRQKYHCDEYEKAYRPPDHELSIVGLYCTSPDYYRREARAEHYNIRPQ
jgi:hypothetical protein